MPDLRSDWISSRPKRNLQSNLREDKSNRTEGSATRTVESLDITNGPRLQEPLPLKLTDSGYDRDHHRRLGYSGDNGNERIEVDAPRPSPERDPVVLLKNEGQKTHGRSAHAPCNKFDDPPVVDEFLKLWRKVNVFADRVVSSLEFAFVYALDM